MKAGLKYKHEYAWLVDRMKKIYPSMTVSNNKFGGCLVFVVEEKNGNGRLWTEDHFLKVIRVIRKLNSNKQLKLKL